MKTRTMKAGIMNHCNVCGLRVKPSRKIRHFQQRHPEYGVYVAMVHDKRKMFCSTCKVSVASLEFLIEHYKRMHMGGHAVESQAQASQEQDGKYTQAQRAGALKALKGGTPPDQVASIMGAPKTTIVRWQAANRTPPESYLHLNDDGSYNRAERHVVDVSVPLPEYKGRALSPRMALRAMLQGLLKEMKDADAKDIEIAGLKRQLATVQHTNSMLQEHVNQARQ